MLNNSPCKALASILFSLACAAGAQAAPARSSTAVALSPDGRWLAVANPDSGTVTLLEARGPRVVAEIKVGKDPRSVAFTDDSRALLSANRGSDDVSWIDVARKAETGRLQVGSLPHGLALWEGKAYVAEHGGDAVVVLNLASRGVERRVAVSSAPAGLAVVPARGSAPALLLVTHFFTGELSVLELPGLAAVKKLSFGPDAGQSQSAAVSPDLKRAYLPQSRSLSANPARTADTTVQPIVRIVDLESLAPAGSIAFDSPVLPAVNRPWAAAVSPDGRLLYCANAGSDDVAVLDALGGRELLHLQAGADPQGLALTTDGKRLFVGNALDGTLSVLEVGGFQSAVFTEPVRQHPAVRARAGTPLPDGSRLIGCAGCHGGYNLPFRRDRQAVVLPDGGLRAVIFPPPSEMPRRPSAAVAAGARTRGRAVKVTKLPLEPGVLRGKKLFQSAASDRLSMGRWVSCASCHPDGGTDRRTWLGFPDGPRDTPALFALKDTLPLHWSGDLDEIHDVEATIRDVQFGRGLTDGPPRDTLGPAQAGRSRELDDLAAYLKTLQPPLSPRTASPESLERGRAAFARLGCAQCHPSPLFTDRRPHDVGTGDPAREKNKHGRGTVFDTPSLLGLWRTPPYFHDGSAPTLAAVLRFGPAHDLAGKASPEETAALVDYLLSLPAADELAVTR